MKTLSLLIIFISLSIGGVAQGFKPEKLSDEINSSYDEINPVVSGGGDTLYFTRVNHPDNRYGMTDSQDIWYSYKDDNGNWSRAQRLPDAVNIARYNTLLSLSGDNQSAIIKGVFDHNGKHWKKRGISEIQTNDFTYPRVKAIKVKGLQAAVDGMYFSANMNAEGTAIIMSYGAGFNSKKQDLYLSEKKNNKWRTPRKLKISSKSTDFAPSFSPDGRSVYFTSNRDGNYEIYKTVSEEGDWQTWSTPELVNQDVSTVMDESFFSLINDGSIAFYTSNQDGSNKDIYKIKLFEPNPYIVVTGVVRDKYTFQPVQDSTLNILVNEIPFDSVVYDAATGNYSATLPLGKKYNLEAKQIHADAETSEINAEGLIEYTEQEMDLFVLPWKFAELSAQVIDKDTQEPLSPFVLSKIMINGEIMEDISLDSVRSFNTKLDLNKKYTIKALAEGYESFEKTVDLSGVDAYKAIVETLVLEKIKSAKVRGRILSQKTLKPIKSGIKVSIKIDGELGLARVDTMIQRFEITLPLGALYVVEAKAENFYPIIEEIDLTRVRAGQNLTQDLTLAPIDVGEKVRINNIFFETGRATLKSESFAELDRAFNFLQEYDKIKIEVGGHTDNVGKAAYNQQLSQRRANSVRNYFIGKGIAEDRITAKGYGESTPFADNKTKEGKQQNRRVEFKILEN